MPGPGNKEKLKKPSSSLEKPKKEFDKKKWRTEKYSNKVRGRSIYTEEKIR